MGFFPLSMFIEFVVCIGVAFILVESDGLMPKVIASFLFISGLAIATLRTQIFIVETSPGVLSVSRLAIYTTSIETILIYVHLFLAYYAVARILRIEGRDPIGRKYQSTP